MTEQQPIVVHDYSSFCPKQYFTEYYSQIGSENSFLLKFFHQAYQNVAFDTRVLEFGGGPTIYQILSAALKVKEIVFADYLEVNRREVKSWLAASPQALNWDRYLNFVLSLNGVSGCSAGRREVREQVTPKVTEIIECDAYLPQALGLRSDNKFDIVSSNFCLECIDAREEVFVEIVEKVSSMIEANGKLILTMLNNATSYQIANINLASFPVTPHYMQALLRSMGYQDISISALSAERSQGYQGLFALTATKR